MLTVRILIVKLITFNNYWDFIAFIYKNLLIFEKYEFIFIIILYKQIWKNLNRVVLKIYTINEKRIYNGKTKECKNLLLKEILMDFYLLSLWLHLYY